MKKERFSELVKRHTDKIVEIGERIGEARGAGSRIDIDLGLEEIRRLYDLFLEGVIEELGKEGEKTEHHEVKFAGAENATRADMLKGDEEQEEPGMEVKEGKPEDDVQKEDFHEVGDGKQRKQGRKEEEVAQGENGEDLEQGKESSTVRGKREKSQENPEVSAIKDEGEGHKTILAEKLGHGEIKSINDIIAARRSDVSISARLQQHPIADLRTAIGINEKFIFVYELFGGNVPLYNEAIEKLNSMTDREAAIMLMEEYRSEYHWDIENMAFQKLVDMVSRRYR